MKANKLPLTELSTWQEELSSLVTSPDELVSYLQLDEKYLEPAKQAAALFPLRTTRSYLARIEKNTPDDPLLRQILPLGEELHEESGYSHDPLGEEQANKAPGLIHKYKGRVLFVLSPQCAINCRYCFRRFFDYNANTPSRSQWQQALAYVRENNSIEEVILSGGDPLSTSDKQLAWLCEELNNIPHLERLRIHSRLPIVLPQRINKALINILKSCRLQSTMVIHCNHSQEINTEVEEALWRLRDARITTLNQSVLLKEVNDSASVLITLSKKLFANGVLPYYLHQLDKVSGAAHFAVNENATNALQRALLEELPGYLVPKFVREIAGVAYKVPTEFK